MRKLELLAPAKNVEIGMAAIAHGADAVYIGPQSHGARQSASNSTDDICKLVEYAHSFRAKVYATVNTIVYDSELAKVEQMIWELYRAGVDALIIQDMGILRMKLPPIQLHASTQCDIRTPQKARFLQDVGFSQLVLARELTLDEIKSIVSAVSIPVESFVHGALCVSYSGRCQLSQICKGRSANRGECAQMCRMPYSLIDNGGKVIASGRHLLSLKDMNATSMLHAMIEAGVSSFKIEGRLKDAQYVKNVVAWYRQHLDNFILANSKHYQRASYGSSSLAFEPDIRKSFNRGFTSYFISQRKPLSIASINTPKSIGEPIKDIKLLHNGDGVAWFDHNNNFIGTRINKIINSSRLQTYGEIKIPNDAKLYRTYDVAFEKNLENSNPKRTMWVDIKLFNKFVSISDERGIYASIGINAENKPHEKNPLKIEEIFSKLGNTKFRLRSFKDFTDSNWYIRPSNLTSIRRNLIDALERTAKASYPLMKARTENLDAKWPYGKLISSDNVANRYAIKFYKDHHAKLGDTAIEIQKHYAANPHVAMTCRYCILRELNLCLKEKKPQFEMPLYLKNGSLSVQLRFCCDRCEMEVLC